jgi:transcriptional regulator with XRE-family HTH domain
MFSESFALRLKSRMQRLGVQANELAEKIGVTPGAVSNWMNGVNEAKGSNLRKLAEVLRCDPHWLVTGDTDDLEVMLKEVPAESELEVWRRRAKAAERRLAQVQAGLRVLLSIGSASAPAGFNSTFLAKAEEIVDAIEDLADQNLREDATPKAPAPLPPPGVSPGSKKPNVP